MLSLPIDERGADRTAFIFKSRFAIIISNVGEYGENIMEWNQPMIVFKRIALLFAGLVIAHFGVTLFLLTNLGSDPFNVLVQGISRQIGWSHGNTHILVNVCIIVILLLTARRYIKIGTVICMLCGGPIIDFFTWIMAETISDSLPFPFKIILLLAGCVILAFGMTVVIKSDAGTGPNDLVSVVISDITGKKFGGIRVLTDITFVAVGFLLGGVFGVGTVICAFLVGIVAGKFMPYSQKLVEYVLGKSWKVSSTE